MSIRKQQMVRLRFEGRKLEDLDFWTKSDPYLTLSRPAKHGPGVVQVRRTETIWNNLSPSWPVLYIPTTELCDANLQMPLSIEVFDEDHNSRDDLIGRVTLTLSDLQNLADSGSPVILKKGPKNRGQLLIRECQFEEPSSEYERKASVTTYPSRKESVYSTLGDLEQSRTNIEYQADAHELLGKGQQNYPTYQPYQSYNPTYQPNYASQCLMNNHSHDGLFSPVGPANNTMNSSYPQPPYSAGYQPFSGHFSPTIPEDPTDTRPAYI